MATSTDITLPTNTTPVFPDGCVVCLDRADSTAKITQHSQNPLAVFFLPFLFLFGWKRVEFPVCRKCKPRFFAQRWGRSIICWTLIFIAISFIAPHFRTWDPTLRKVAIAGLCLLVMLPYFTFEVFFPRSFDTTAYAKTTTYEFKSQELGLQFYSLNKQKHPYSKIEIQIGD